MSDFVFAPFFGGAVNLALAIFIYTRAPQRRLNQIFLLWGLALTLWCVGAGALFVVHSQQHAVVWARLLHLGVIWIPATGLHVCLLMADAAKDRRYRLLLKASYAVTVVLMALNAHGLYIGAVVRVEYGWFARAGPGFWIFSNFMPCATIPAIFALLQRARVVPVQQRRKYIILVAANSLLMVAGTHDLAPVLGWMKYPGTSISIFPWGTYAAGLYGLLVAYAVLQDQILEVRVTLSRYAAYTVRLGFFCSVALLLLIIVSFAAPRGMFTRGAVFASIGVICASAAVSGWLFPKLFGGATEGIERRLLGDRFEYQEQIAALTDSVHRETNLDSMWHEVGDVLHRAMKVRPVHCFVLGKRRVSAPFRYTAPEGHASEAELLKITPDSAILTQFSERSEPLNVRMPSRRAKTWQAALDEAKRIGADYVFPLKGVDRAIGFIAVGGKADGSAMSAFDLELLQRLAQRAGWATERTVLAEQVAFAEKHELLALMSRGLAHDLNNLLTPVSTILQLSGRNVVPGSLEAGLFEAAYTSLRTVRSYVEEAIFFAKDLRPRMTEIIIAEILAEATAVVDARAGRHQVKIDSSADDGSFVGDAVLCQRVLANLLSNAIDASHEGRSVSIEGRVDARKGVVRFTVKDSGVGIPAENMPKIWQPYFTTKDSVDDDRGFGLGLAVCQLLVELHQGVIALESQEGVGTVAIVELPKDGAGQPVWVPTHYIS